MEVARVTGECGVGSRTSVCSGIDKGVESDVGDKDEVVDSVPPTDRWADGMNESRTGAVSPDLCRA